MQCFSPSLKWPSGGQYLFNFKGTLWEWKILMIEREPAGKRWKKSYVRIAIAMCCIVLIFFDGYRSKCGFCRKYWTWKFLSTRGSSDITIALVLEKKYQKHNWKILPLCKFEILQIFSKSRFRYYQNFRNYFPKCHIKCTNSRYSDLNDAATDTWSVIDKLLKS